MSRAAALALVLGAAIGLPAPSAVARAPVTEVVGHSHRGRPIVATVVGDPGAQRRVLVVGCIHGTEPAGRSITRRLARVIAPRGVALWIVDSFNPDGCAAGTRGNARGVDLNRNQPRRWRPLGPRGTLFHAGVRPRSERESRAIAALVRRVRPALSFWYHQHAALVDDSGGDRRIGRCLAALTGLPFRRFGRPPGSITSWQNHTFRHATALVVELPPGRLSRREISAHADGVLALAAEGPQACITGFGARVPGP